ncbi:M10 family metallopeptidase C-terminal domain-containing protein [Actibacterium sp. 188UL27-1]|uniref:M10 family metallopeptidase C-terminal domain-containing protein n=1 Tax=Actibacterium sp. 188UL27-1 TaxID=2786961 RepID=UPI00195D27CF|nr:M10 family metallopeptidase C-terminal domain-containing protein [Actibacterium sp. 188UL27-1]MBM7069571.1 M10 family metallopeptidase C-terminal domain-containing protein [Actibacterium sp. 188UL27-1]
MPTKPEILNALQFDLDGLSNKWINRTSDPAYVFTYQFANGRQPSDLWRDYTGWKSMNGAERDAVREGLDHIESIANIRFVEVSGQADPDLNLGKADLPGFAGIGGYNYSYYGDGGLAEYDAFTVFDTGLNLADNPSLILHEVGHALALRHPFEHDAELPAQFESNKYTVMSYDYNPDIQENGDVLQLYDILALQDLWGANTETRKGNTTYYGPRSETVDAIYDAGGTDTLSAQKNVTPVQIDLRQGQFSQFNGYDDVVIAYGTVIENARGSRLGDTITGNTADNLIWGHGGFDEIDGGKGDDMVWGGSGDDRIFGGDGEDTLRGNQGNDRISGGWGHDTLIGHEGNDILLGNHGHDRMNGNSGNDVMTGGKGRDTFAFREGGDHDRITDFKDDIDTILLDMVGVNSVHQAQKIAQQDGADVVYDFGGGDVLRVEDIRIAALWDDLTIA